MSDSLVNSPFYALGNIDDTGEVRAQVEDIVRAFAPGHDMSNVSRTFDLMDRALAGELPGYHELKTLYHNRSHTNEVVLCSARILHGLALAGKGLDAQHIDAALIGALMHDIGYLMADAEAAGTGAQFTDSHVLRGAAFTKRFLADLPEPLLDSTVKVILLTDHRKTSMDVKFDNLLQQRAAYATASADLIGQMANRTYLERLLLLYFEFEEAQMGGFTDFHELLERTSQFYLVTRRRLENELQGIAGDVTRHFGAEKGVERNFYSEAIDLNLRYLDRLISETRQKRLELLKRGGVVEQVLELKKAP